MSIGTLLSEPVSDEVAPLGQPPLQGSQDSPEAQWRRYRTRS